MAQTKPWRDEIPAEEWDIYREAGFGRPSGLGARPVILVIDVQYRTVGDEPLPLRESIRRHYRTSCGEAGWSAVAAIAALLKRAREFCIPVIYPYVAPKTSADVGRTGTKIPTLLEVQARGYEFVREVAPQPENLLIPKRHPSAFFGTPLLSYLIDLHVDSLVITGCTTSGCVRATTVDAFAYNLHCAVVEECVYDRSHLGHIVNLFDMQSKYADVLSLSETLAYLESQVPVEAGSS